MAFELTEMRKKIFKIMAQVGDLTTGQDQVEQYVSFLNALHTLAERTDALYTQNEQGVYPTITDANLGELRDAYRQVQREGAALAGGGEGPVGQQMAAIATEVLTLANQDMTALEVVDVKAGITLPEVIANARTLTVDVGNQEFEISSGHMSNRIPLTIETDDGTTVEGFFTETNYVDTKKNLQQAVRDLTEQFPDYKPILDAIRNASDRELMRYGFEPLQDQIDDDNQGMSTDEIREDAKNQYKERLGNSFHLPTDVLDNLASREDFLQFTETISQKIQPLILTKKCYTDAGHWLGLPEGVNIDKRNAAMSSVSAFLGKPDLLANARPMVVMKDGKAIAGTFMEKAPGVDPIHIKWGEEQIKDYTIDNFDNPGIFDDIAGIQVIDYICGNVDRHPGNFILNFDPYTNKLVKITGIDNDLSFGVQEANRTFVDVGNKLVAPAQMMAIGEEMAIKVLAMTKDTLSFTLSGYGLSQAEIDAAWDRTEMMKQEIRRGMDHYANVETGKLDQDYLRVIKKEEWSNYQLQQFTKEDNQFRAFANLGSYLKKRDQYHEVEQNLKRRADKILGIKPNVRNENDAQKVTIAKPISNGMMKDGIPVDRYGIKSPETMRITIAPNETIHRVGGFMSRRIPLEFQQEQQTMRGFFTESNLLDRRHTVNRILDRCVEENPRYAKELEAMRNYYLSDPDTLMTRVFDSRRFPYEDWGFTPQQAGTLRKDEDFVKMVRSVASELSSSNAHRAEYVDSLWAMDGSSVERRNVAMSKVGDLLGTPDLLARSTTMQMQVGDRIVHGVVTEAAKGIERSLVKAGDPVLNYGEEVFDQGPALRSLAELQIIDYICMNVDRHGGNMLYQFSDDKPPRFLGVTGIDNDLSFGARNPKPNESMLQETPLDAIDLVSERMAEKLRNLTPEDLEQTLKDQGIGKASILAAQERLARIQTRIDSGKIRVVPDAEWNTMKLVDLAKEKTIFATVHNTFTVDIPQLVQQQARDPKMAKDIQYTKANRVEAFSEDVIGKQNEKVVFQETQADFEQQMQEQVKQLNAAEVKTNAQLLHLIREGTQNIYQALDAADPMLMRSSVHFRNMKKAAKELKTKTAQLEASLQQGEQPTAEQMENLVYDLSDLNAKCAVYVDYKLDQKDGVEESFNQIEQRRVASARNCSEIANRLMGAYRTNEPLAHLKHHAYGTIQRELASIQETIDAAGKSLEDVQDMAATMIYYKAIGASKNKLGDKITSVLLPEAKQQAIDQIKQSLGFQDLIHANNKDALIALARDGVGDKLYKTFLMKSAAHAPAKPQQVQQQAQKQNQQPQMGGPGGH